MKGIQHKLILVFAVLAGLGTADVALAYEDEPPAAAEPQQVSETAKSAQEHLALAESYDSRVQDLDRLIADHEQMKRDQRRFYSVNPKVATKTPVAEMDKHCDAIIRDTKKLQADLRDFAAWHRARAAELERK